MPKICLVMIVKNEKAVIARCLASVAKVIDYAVICDTGSVDGTQSEIAAFLCGAKIDYTQHQHDWQDFASNRNKALRAARQDCPDADWFLMMDADHVLHAMYGLMIPDNAPEAFYLTHKYAGSAYPLACLLRAQFPFWYEGVIHEYLTSAEPHSIGTLGGAWIEVFHDGARARDPNTYQRDIEVLQRAVYKEPDNARYRFYLAQSYKDARQYERAIDAYTFRANMQGTWEEERWYALFEAAKLTLWHGPLVSPDVAEAAMLLVHKQRPSRAEPLIELAAWQRQRRNMEMCLLYARAASVIPYPAHDKLFVDTASYLWRPWDEIGIAGWYCQCHEEGAAACRKLLAERLCPDDQRARVQNNFDHYQK